MAKRKQENIESLQASYKIANDELHIDKLTMIDQVHELVNAADKVLTKICEGADTIKIHTYNEIKERYANLGIPKNVWLELVNLRRLKLFTSIPDKVLERIDQSYAGMRNVAALRESLVGDLIDDKPLRVSSVESAKALQYERDFELDSEFMDLLNNCATIRNHLDTVLWPKLKIYGEAFCYLTKEPYQNFKFLLDMKHYQGGWPSEKTPPRIWKAIAGFRYVFETMERWGYSDHRDWAKRFGLSVKLGQQHPSRFTFTDLAKEFSKFKQFTIRQESLANYSNLGVQPWHHAIDDGTDVFFYIWDTRLVQIMVPSMYIAETDRNYDIIDNCQPLVPANDEIKTYMRVNLQKLIINE